MLLLLLWRHLEYYAEPKNMNNPPAQTSITNAMRLLATMSPEQFREEITINLGPLLQRIVTLDIVGVTPPSRIWLTAEAYQDQDSMSGDWQSNRAYIEIMSRRLRDSTGLLIEGPKDEWIIFWLVSPLLKINQSLVWLGTHCLFFYRLRCIYSCNQYHCLLVSLSSKQGRVNLKGLYNIEFKEECMQELVDILTEW
jgi:hypothetical protein